LDTNLKDSSFSPTELNTSYFSPDQHKTLVKFNRMTYHSSGR